MLGLVYVSTALYPFSPGELADLLARARAHNLRQGITGILLYRDGDFLQVLEGPGDAVRRTYGLIRHDPRHGRVILLDERPVARRMFGEWSLGFRRVLPSEAEVGFSELLAGYDHGDDRRHPGEAVRRYLDSCRSIA